MKTANNGKPQTTQNSSSIASQFLSDPGGLSAAQAAAPGDICLMEVPFTDGADIKIRPALVLATQGPDLVVAPLTTHRPRNAFDVELAFWLASGLPQPSTVRCGKVSPLSRKLVFAILGQTVNQDWQRVRRAARRWFQRIVMSATLS